MKTNSSVPGSVCKYISILLAVNHPIPGGHAFPNTIIT